MNLSALDLNLLVALDALLAERNVTRAASRVGLSQPAMSRALARLRDIFADPLLVRANGEMQPTARALELGPPLRQALEQIRHVVAPARAFDPSDIHLSLSIATIDYMEYVLLPALLPQLRRRAPGVELMVRPTNRMRITDMLLTGEADLAFWPLSMEVTELRTMPLIDEQMLCLAARDHPLVDGELTLALYQSLPHVRVSPDGRGTSTVDSVLAARGLRRRVAAVVTSHLAVPRIIANSDMIATLPGRIATALASHEAVQVLRPPLKLTGFTIDMIWPPRHDADPRHVWLRDLISEIASGL